MSDRVSRQRPPSFEHLAVLAAWVLSICNRKQGGVTRGLVAAFVSVLFCSTAVHAQDATWQANPGTNSWNTSSNWSPSTVPTGTATFGASTVTSLTFSAAAGLDTLRFTAGAPAYTFQLDNNDSLVIGGTGIINDSASQPTFTLQGGSFFRVPRVPTLTFANGATAGNAIMSNSLEGIISFTDQSSAGSANITNNSTLLFGGNSTAANSTILNTAGFRFSNSSSADHAVITNTGGVMSFFDTSTAGNATITSSSGDIFFQNSSSAGNATIITNNGARTFFEDTSSGGNARLVTNAGGAVDITFQSTGMTAGSIEGAGTYYLGSKLLTVGSNGLSTEVSGVIADGGLGNPFGVGGTLTKLGSGTLTLSGVNTYTGATTVNAGSLLVTGDISNSSGVTVNSGGLVGGTGALPSTTINNGGKLAPGTSIGTVTVRGNLTFNAGSTYEIEVSPTAADRTNVTGTAALAGRVNATFQPGTYLPRSYTILSATGARSGTFDTFTTNSTLLSATLSYTATDVLMNLVAGIGNLTGLNQNQSNVGNTITNAFNSGGGIGAPFATLFSLPSSALPGAFTQLSGEAGTAATQAGFQSMDSFLSSMLSPFADSSVEGADSFGAASGFAAEDTSRPGLATAYAAVTPKLNASRAPAEGLVQRRWSVWATGYGGSSTTSGNSATGTQSTSTRLYGTVVGADYRVSPSTVIGFAAGGAGLNFGLDQGLGSGRADAFQLGVFGRHTLGPAYISAALGYGWQNVTTDRTVTVSGTDRLHATLNANTFAARGEAGYRFATPWLGLTPYAGLQATSFALPNYAESATSGSNQYALSYASQTTTNVRTELGARIDKSFLVGGRLLTLRSRAAWAHDSNTDRRAIATFQTLPGATFTVNGAQPSANAALLSVGADMKFHNGWSVAANFDGEFSRNTAGYAGKGSVRYAW